MAKGIDAPGYAEWDADKDVYIPEPAASRRQSVLAGGPGRRASSLGTFHHAGRSSWVVAAGHLITAIIGAGVLGLPNAIAWLGIVAGPLAIAFFFVATMSTLMMLADCYHVNGKRHTRYKWAVLHIMGERHAWVLAASQNTFQLLATIGYQIAAADSMRYITKLACEMQGRGECPLPDQWQHTLIFGALQVVMSQLPNLESAWWASAVGAVMSFGYSIIALALGASQAGNLQASVVGRPAPMVDRVFGILNSFGTIAFAFNGSICLMEIQDTLREPPAAAVSMKKTLGLSMSVTFFFYMAVGVLGYLALGDAVPDNVLLGFHTSPRWVNIIANAMLIAHLAPAYQVYGQPLFGTIEDVCVRFAPTLQFATPAKERAFRLAYRSVYVAFTTFVACLLPFFGAFIGLIGALTFFPTAVFYPIMMYRRVKPVVRWQSCYMWAIMAAMGAAAVMGTVGSVESIADSATKFRVFANP